MRCINGGEERAHEYINHAQSSILHSVNWKQCVGPWNLVLGEAKIIHSAIAFLLKCLNVSYYFLLYYYFLLVFFVDCIRKVVFAAVGNVGYILGMYSTGLGDHLFFHLCRAEYFILQHEHCRKFGREVPYFQTSTVCVLYLLCLIKLLFHYDRRLFSWT